MSQLIVGNPNCSIEDVLDEMISDPITYNVLATRFVDISYQLSIEDTEIRVFVSRVESKDITPIEAYREVLVKWTERNKHNATLRTLNNAFLRYKLLSLADKLEQRFKNPQHYYQKPNQRRFTPPKFDSLTQFPYQEHSPPGRLQFYPSANELQPEPLQAERQYYSTSDQSRPRHLQSYPSINQLQQSPLQGESSYYPSAEQLTRVSNQQKTPSFQFAASPHQEQPFYTNSYPSFESLEPHAQSYNSHPYSSQTHNYQHQYEDPLEDESNWI